MTLTSCGALRQIVFLASIVSAQQSGSNAKSAQTSESLRVTALEKSNALQLNRKQYHLDFENGEMRVLRLTLDANSGTRLHKTADSLLVCIDNCDVRFEEPGGRIHDVHMDPGESRWIWASMRSEKNLSGKPLQIVVIELKKDASQAH